MTDELLTRLNEETLRELDYANEFDGVVMASPEYKQIMDHVRENCKILNQEAQISIEEYKAVEDAKLKKQTAEEEATFKKQKELVDLNEKRKDRWVNLGMDIGKFMISEGIYCVLVNRGFIFEERGSVSSFFLRNLLNRMKPN